MNNSARPNIVIIYADDLGWGDVGCFGADDIPTPHIDSIAAAGVRLPQWYSNSPVCSPSRASLMTGRYPAHAGVEAILGGTRHTPGLPKQSTLASRLRERGYRTGIFGKWHLGASAEYSPRNFGFEESFGLRAGCVDYYSHIFYWGDHNPIHDLWQNDEEVWLNGEYLTTEIGRRAAEFISAQQDTSFFCYVPFNAPHYPMHAPAKYMERFAHLPDGRRTMAAMVSAMDDAIGVVLGALREAGLSERTLVFLSSDNGPSAESRNWLDGEEISYDGGSTGGFRGSKGSLFDGGIRVPGIVSWPARLPQGVDFDEVGVMMDIVPTILDAVDGSAPELDGVDGMSLLAQLEHAGKESTDAERTVFWAYEGQWAARRGRFKLVVDAREGMVPPHVVDRALYDLELDPAEGTDVERQHPQLAVELHTLLEEFRREHADWVRSGAAVDVGLDADVSR